MYITKINKMKNISILYIENNDNNTNTILGKLKNKVINITIVSSKKNALKKFKENKFDLVIVTLDFNDANTFKFLKKVRKDQPEINSIIILENSCEEVADGLSKISIINDFISKDESINKLHKFIKKNIKKIIKRRDYKETYSLLGHYKEALDESWVVIKTNLQGTITYVNDNFYKTSGYSTEEVLGHNISMIRQVDIDHELYNESWKTIQSRKIFKAVIEYRKKDGSSFFMNSTIIPVIDNLNDVLEYISISFDITQLKNALNKAQSDKKAKSIFLANMSHEIRTPLNGILGFCKLLKNEDLNKHEEKEYIDIINKSALSLLSIINEILDISKIESGKFELELGFFNPTNEFEIVTELFSSLANEKNITYLFYLDPKLPKKIFGDSLRIKQILTNLISNAIKFTPENGEIYIEVTVLEKTNKCKFKVSVTDNGIGISQDKQKTIFKPFEQADNSISRKYGGTGLGLSIAFNVLSLMNSKIHLESKLDHGSAFSFILNTNYEDGETKFNDIEELKVLIYTNNSLKNNNQLQIIQKYLDVYSYALVQNSLDNINEFDVLIIEYNEFKQLNIDSIAKPVIIINKTTLNLKDYKSSFRFLKTPINPDKLYDTILDALDIKNTKTTLLQEKLRSKDIKFRGNVLIAEDDDINQQLIQIILENKGVHVDTVHNGLEAIDYITQLHQDTSLDFILMDINMPIMDGILATQKIKQYEEQYKLKHIPIIALTANAITGDKEKYLDLGMDNYLTKPIRYSELYEILNEYLEKDSQQKVIKEYNKTKENNSEGFNNNNNIDEDISFTYSLEESASLVGVSTEIFTKIFTKYINGLEEKITQLTQHISNNDFKEIETLAHTLKGSSGNMNVTKLYDIFRIIELNAKDKNPNNYEEELIKIDQIREILKKIV